MQSVGKYRILPYLKSNGVNEIDYWFVSHTDLDHISGLLEIFDEDTGSGIWCSSGDDAG